jgi:hypothetical protein
MTPGKARVSLLRAIASVAPCLLGVVILFLLVEGLASSLFVFRDYLSYWSRGSKWYIPRNLTPSWAGSMFQTFTARTFTDPAFTSRPTPAAFATGKSLPPQLPAARCDIQGLET